MFTLLSSRSDEVSRSRRGLVVAAAAALFVSTLAAIAPASAVSTTLVISEVYVNGGSAGASYTNKYVELHNKTGAPIDLAGTSLQYRPPTASGNSSTAVALIGTVPSGGYFTILGGSNGANGIAVPGVDQTISGFNPGGNGGTVTLASVTAAIDPSVLTNVIDKVGYGTSNTAEGTVATGNSVSLSLARNTAGSDTDDNSADFAAAAGTPDAANGPVAPGPLAATSPGAKSGQVGSPVTGFTLAATGGTSPYTWAATGLPDGVTVAASGAVSGTPTTAGTVNVIATVTDAGTPTPATEDVSFTYTIAGPASLVPIAEIQGTGSTSPVAGLNVKTQGVVTASYPTGGLNGFYIQTPGADTANASDAIFVYGGTSGFTTYPDLGDSVEVTGQATEFSGATQISASQAGVVPVADLGAVTPKTQIPGADCALPGTDCLGGAALDEAREVSEGELFQPTAPWTATDVYDGSPYHPDTTNSGAFRGELGVVANSTKALVAPTEVIDAQATALIAERKKYNDAHRIILDDASSLTFSTTLNSNQPFPWFTADHTVRVGAAITFPKPVILTFGFNTWRILPQAQVTGDSTGAINFAQTRPLAPKNVGGDVKLATFNVLNFFPTTGEEFVASALGTCSFYNDRAANPITNNQCNPNGPRGAANNANLVRQRDKIVAAINTADADIVSLEELENSVKFNKPRDFAIDALVTALNADAGADTWAAVPSAAVLPPTAEQDVIRSGFIYQPANVALVGESIVLSDQSSTGGAFEDAREPVAQAFKQVGTADSDAFAVIVNHFKSKGSGTPDPDGQGNSTDRRVIQANALVAFADSFKTQRSISRVFLAGDFNAYSEEDPIQVLEAAGYTNLESTSQPDEETYNFDGQIGSLDHVLANDAAEADVNAVDVWDINGYESLYYEYSRFNTNVTNLYTANPFRSSDHSPEIVGINAGTTAPTQVASSVTATVTPASIQAQTGTANVSVTVSAAGATPTGVVLALIDDRVVGGGELVAGKVDVPVGPFAAAGSKALTIRYYGDAATLAGQGTVSLTVTAPPVTPVVKADATVRVTIAPTSVTVLDEGPTVSITVTKASGTPTGAVLAFIDGKVVEAGELVDGKASFSLAPFTSVGTRSVEVRYLGDDTTKRATSTTSVDVVKAVPKLKVKAPNRAEKGEKVKITVEVNTAGFTPTGKVTIKVAGQAARLSLENGSVTVRVRLNQTGQNKIRVSYSGDDRTEKASKEETIKVTR